MNNTVRHKSNLEIVCIWSPLSWMLIHFCFSTCFAKKIFSMRLSWTIVPSGSDSGCHLNKNIRPYTGLKSKIKFGWILLSNSYKPTLYVTQQWILIKSKCIKNLFTHTNTTKTTIIIEKIFNTLITYHAYNCWKKKSYLRFSKLEESKLHNSSTWSPSQPAFERIKMSNTCHQCKIYI